MRRIALAFTCLLMLAAASIEAQPVRYVLLLQSLDRGNVIIDSLTGDLRIDLDRLAGTPVNVLEVVVGPTGFVGAPEDALADYIRSTFPSGREPELIVALGAPATVFARTHRKQLFPNTPLVVCIDQRLQTGASSDANETNVTPAADFSLIIEDILQLLPETKQVFMVVGGPIGKYWLRNLQDDFKRFQGRVTFEWSNDSSLPQMLRRCANLPPGSAIYYFSFGSDASGAAYADERVLAELHATANAPLFAAQTAMLGHGIVGGRMMSVERLASKIADVSVRILHGASPSSIHVPLEKPGQATFDWRELKRWRIPESRLPAGSIVRYRAPGPWREYRAAILSAIGVLIVQSLLIVGLIYQRRARQRAEAESQRNLALAADVGRRQTMSALTSSIAHELGQPLSSMIFNAQALQMMISADHATPETIREVLSDIQTQGERATQIITRHRTMLRSRQVDKKPIDIQTVIDESLALVARDMKDRHIQATVDIPSDLCVISGDEILLQQVLVNLVMNAMDAMAETAPGPRRLIIRSEVKGSDVQIAVRDSGTGVPPQIIDTLFTPFVTTKSHGLGIGLTIARSIVDAHGGAIDARNNPEGGATFTVTLPCGGARRTVLRQTQAAVTEVL